MINIEKKSELIPTSFLNLYSIIQRRYFNNLLILKRLVCASRWCYSNQVAKTGRKQNQK